jgi:hypothetical protein
MQFGQAKPAVGVIFDSDMGNGIDDVLSLAVLFGISGKGESRVVGVSVSKPSLKAAAFCDALVRFFSAEAGGFQPAAFGGGGSLPIGLTVAGKNGADTPIITATLAASADGKPAFSHTIEKMNDTADPVAVIRNALSAQNEKNAVVVLGGPATNLAALLALPPAKGLIEDRARLLVAALGSYPQGGPDPAVTADLAAARKLFAEWPGPVLATGTEVGEVLRYPGASLDAAFSWAPRHPLVEAYKAAGTMPYDAPAACPAGILQALRPQENYFKLSEPGTISVLDDGRTKFTPSSSGKHRYLIADPAQKERVLQALVELASAKPVPRVQRFRPQQKKQ